jgi:hypothetical protein
LARYPDLIPGDDVDPDVPRRWLLIAREAGVPRAEPIGPSTTSSSTRMGSLRSSRSSAVGMRGCAAP